MFMPRLTNFLRAFSLLSAVSLPLFAQQERHAPPRRAARTDTLYLHYAAALDSLSRHYSTSHYEKGDTLGNPYYFRLFSAGTLFEGSVRSQIGSLGYRPGSAAGRLTRAWKRRTENESGPLSARFETLGEGIDSCLMAAYTEYPWLVVRNEAAEKDTAGLRDDLSADVKADIRLGDDTPDAHPLHDPALTDDSWGIIVRKPNFWNFSTNFSLQFMQTYVSDNWYKGGENNNSLLASAVIKANYNNKSKISFENTLELKLGFLTSEGDDLHKYKTNNDLIRMTNKLGLQAIGRWNYTAMLQSWTQFYRGYKSNDAHVYSDFMSPFESVFSLGMSYKLSNVKNLTLDATVSPFSVNFKYVDRLYLATSFGLKEGRHTKFEYGSNITVTYTWNIWKNIQWTGRIYYFTDYSKAQLEWENTFNLKINKFLTTKLFLYPRFDDSVARQEGRSYFQFNENLSVGLDVSF